MFQGETAITIDDKGRLAVPTVYRDAVARDCANRLVITYNPFESGSLYLYPQVAWERLRDQVNALPKAKAVNRSMQLKLVGAAAFVELDGNGRISIPASHRSAVGIEKKAVLLGMGAWERLRDQVNALPKAKAVNRSMQLKLVGAAAFVELDGNGRISIPASHRSAVGIEKKAVLLGMGDKFELWSEQAHHAQIRQTISDADLSEELLDLQL